MYKMITRLISMYITYLAISVSCSGGIYIGHLDASRNGSFGLECLSDTIAFCATQPWGQALSPGGGPTISSACPVSLVAPTAVSASALRADCFTALPLASATAVSSSSSLYRFLLPAGASLQHVPGSHLLLAASDASGRPVTRAYGPVSPPDAAGYFEVYIRRYPLGAMSWRVQRWRPGQLALWSGPFGGYRARPADRRLVLLAAGTGVAPLVGVIRAALQQLDGPRLTLLLSARRLQEVFPRRQLARWARAARFDYQLFVTDARERDGEGTEREWPGEPVRWRRLHQQDVLDVVLQQGGKTRYLICGTDGFVEVVQSYLWGAGINNRDVLVF